MEEEEEVPREEPFTLPLPPPPFGFPPPDRDVVFFAHRRGGRPGREHDDVMFRRVPKEVAHRFRGAAGARGMTHAQYLAALVALHDAMRQRADGGDADVAAELQRLGLSTVSI